MTLPYRGTLQRLHFRVHSLLQQACDQLEHIVYTYFFLTAFLNANKIIDTHNLRLKRPNTIHFELVAR